MRRKDTTHYRLMVRAEAKDSKPVKIGGDMTLGKALNYQRDRIWTYLNNYNTTILIEPVGDHMETGRLNHLKVTQDQGKKYSSTSHYWIEPDAE